MMTEAIATGMRHATMSAVDQQSEMAYIDHAKACEKSLLSAPLERRLLGMDEYLPLHTGASSQRQEARHFQSGEFRRPKEHMIGDVGNELPEDAELENLVEMDIPGLVVAGEVVI